MGRVIDYHYVPRDGCGGEPNFQKNNWWMALQPPFFTGDAGYAFSSSYIQR
jgi:hypothetical protein